MDFNNTGYLDAGFHTSTVDQIKSVLVDPHPNTSSRHHIFEGYCKHKSELEKLPISFEQWFDGSFVSRKENPSDIDLLNLAHRTDLAKLSPDQQVALKALVAGKGNVPEYSCDSYFLMMVDETDPAYPHYRQLRKYWMGEFGFDRQDTPKGILRISVTPSAASTAAAPGVP